MTPYATPPATMDTDLPPLQAATTTTRHEADAEALRDPALYLNFKRIDWL